MIRDVDTSSIENIVLVHNDLVGWGRSVGLLLVVWHDDDDDEGVE